MRSTREADYAVMTMTFLACAEPGDVVIRREIAERLSLPDKFLAKILRKLTRAGLVRSFHGVHGGYRIGKDTGEISLADIVRAIDGPVVLTRSLEGRRGVCDLFCLCEATEAVRRVQEKVMTVLEEMSLSEMIGQRRGSQVSSACVAEPLPETSQEVR